MARPLPSSGPYELAYWRLNDKVRLIKNPRYWDDANTQSKIIDLLPVASSSTALNLYESGQADIVWDKTLVPVELLDVLLKRPDFHTFDFLGTYFIRMNVTHKPFNDPRVRMALVLAVDKNRIVKKLLKAGEKTASHFVPDGVANYASPAGLGYDPERAKQLLAEAGYPGGKGFPRFDYVFDSAAGGGAGIHQNIAVELQQMWHDTLGIDMELRQMEWKVYLSTQTRLDYDLSRSSWIGDYNDPQTFLSLFTSNDGNNRTGWKNPEYDAFIQAAGNEPDVKKRAQDFQEAESLLVNQQVPIIPLYFYVGVNFFDTNRIHGIYQNILDNHPLNCIKKVPGPK